MKCQKCNSENMGIITYHTASGSIVYPWCCIDCNKRTTHYVSKKDFAIHADFLTDIVHHSEYKQICQVCGTIGAELHHYAPYYLFKEECNAWPTGYLCIPCHKKWHKLVTPNMCQKQ